MSATPADTDVNVTVEASDLSDLESLAAGLAENASPGDLIALWGDLGAGKTTFARAFIQARAHKDGREIGEVPSPTFTLVQSYELPSATIWHFDLYRLENSAEVWELGIEEALADGITLVEWPERMGTLLPARRIDVALEFADAPDRRHITVKHGDD
jgi:tRNA threonylcarbamoyladenosine biosynthesis protein TsaE